jgi:glycosyltransferase involved in cell wall biosynthesis
MRWLTRLVLRWGHHFIVQSDEEGRRLQLLLPGALIEVVPHPVYAMFGGLCIPKQEARRRLQLPIDGPLLLFFGIIRPYKGLGNLIEALPCVWQRAANIHLLIAGEFWEDKSTHLARIHQLDLGPIVRIDDRYIPNEEVALYFSAADLLVAPYRQTTGSGVIELAKSFGLPIVTAPIVADLHDHAGQAGVADDARCARLADAIIDALEQLATQIDPPVQADERASWQRLVRAIEGAR